jgi:NAD dependent epimerase/dehydratase family enzyme
MKNKKIIIAGGTGFIGQALAARWGKDNHVVILSRQGAGERKNGEGARRNGDGRNNAYGRKLLSVEDGYNITYWRWDGRHVEKHWADEIEGCDLVINLAGRSVNCRYTPKNKQEIFDSRTDATRVIGQAIRDAVVPPKLWINAASATIYRHAEDRPQDEYTGETGEGFPCRSVRNGNGPLMSKGRLLPEK